MSKRAYADADRERARVAWETNGHSIRATARETGFPIATVQAWVVAWGRPVPAVAPEAVHVAYESIRTDKKAEIIIAAWDLAKAAFVQAQKRLPQANAKDAATVAGIAIDKAQLLSGGATERVDVRAILAQLPAETRQAVIALLATDTDEG